MRNFFSAIILKSGPALFSWDSDSHETIKEESKLKDDKLPPDFVPVELTPPDGNYGETDLSKWVFKTERIFLFLLPPSKPRLSRP